MTRLRAAAGVARLTLRTCSSSVGGFGSVAPRPHSCAPSPCFLPLSRLSGSFRSVSLCLEELQRAWEREPSSAGHWVDALSAGHRVDPVSADAWEREPSSAGHWVDALSAGHRIDPVSAGHRIDPVSADHWVDALSADHRIDPVCADQRIDPVSAYHRIDGALHPSAAVGRQILQESIQLLLLVRLHQVSGNMMTQVDSLGYDDRLFPDRFYRSNQADIEREFLFGLSGMPGEKLSYLPFCKPKVHCHLDDRVTCDWFWKSEATAIWTKVITNKSSLSNHHWKMLKSDRLMRQTEAMISGNTTENLTSDLPGKSDWLWPDFNSAGPTSHLRTRLYSVITSVGHSHDFYPPLIIWKSECHNELHHTCEQIPVHSITYLENLLQVVQVDKNKANLLKLNHRKLLGVVIRGSDKVICGYASKINEYLEMKHCGLPAKRDRLLPCFESPGKISNARSLQKTDGFLESVNDDLCYDYDGQGPAGPNAYLEVEHFLQMSNSHRRGSSTKFKWPAASSLPSLQGARFHCRRYYSTSGKNSEILRPQKENKIPPPTEWLAPAFEESLMRRVWPPDVSCPDHAMLVKTIPGVVPETCIDESVFLINYDPYAYVKARPLFRREVIHGSQSSVSGDKPFIWLAYDHAVKLMQSLPLLARFFHEQNLCLPRLTLNDLVITGAGTFRLRGTDISFRECTPENIRDVYSNIRTLLMELLVASVGPAILKELPEELDSLFVLMKDGGFRNEYLICFHAFFIPLSNKSHALLRIIDEILELPKDNVILSYLLGGVLSHKQMWQYIATSNTYLRQWFSFRKYGRSRREFILFLRAIICHKLEHGLPDKLVDFLLFALFPNVLRKLQRDLSDIGRLRGLHMEELYLHNARPGFVAFDDESLIEEDEDGTGVDTLVEVADFSYVRRLIQENQRVIDFSDGRRIWENSVLAKLKVFASGGVSELDNLIQSDNLFNFVRGDERVVD